MPDVGIDSTIFRPATFIEMSLENLNRALLIGCLLVILVLIVFLYDWRTALISIIAIPLSLIAAALVLRYRGGTLDTMVIAGLIIALGEVVDDAIIDVENIVRRLRLNAAAGNPRSAFQVVLDASVEVRSAVVYGSLIVILVFVPVFLLEGLAGSFFRPLALSYVLAILASLLVALIVTPALSLHAAAEAHARARSPGRHEPQDTVSPGAARPDRAAETRNGHRRAVAGRHRCRVPAPRRGVPPELPGVRLPDALGREARDVARGDAARHRQCRDAS